MPLTIAITGGRTYKLQPADWLWLGMQCGQLMRDGLQAAEVIFIHGDATGVDAEVGTCLERYGYKVKKYPAQWEMLGRYAGPARNKTMAEIAQRVWAFPGGKGTQNMVDYSRELGLLVEESPERTGKRLVL